MMCLEYKGHKYWYVHKLAKKGDVCLATYDPTKYCNGYFLYSLKDPGDGKEFVIIQSDDVNCTLKSQMDEY